MSGTNEGRSFLINYDELSIRPAREIPWLSGFSGVDVDEYLVLDLAGIQKKTSRHERFMKWNLSIFTQQQIKEARSPGFTVLSDEPARI